MAGEEPLHKRYQGLLRAARSLFSITELNEVVDLILRQSIQIMDVEGCSMYLPDHDTEELIIYSARVEEDTAFHTARFPWHQGIAGSVFRDRQPARIDDVLNDSRRLRTFDNKTDFVPRAMVCIPLVDKTDCLGVLQAINPVGRPVFTEVDQEILEGLAGILTSSLIRLEREQKLRNEAQFAQELSLAHEIQKSFLPPTSTVLPHVEFHVHYQPARTIGGDFYAAFPLSDSRFLVATGDVSGKGIPAALTTAQVAGELNALTAILTGSLTDWVRRLNTQLCGRLAAGRFVATTFMLYDGLNHTVEVCCAGQFPPWRESEGKWGPVEAPRGLPLGVFKDYAYKALIYPCSVGEKWIMFSDGITEGRNANEEEYGDARLRESLHNAVPKRILDKAWDTWSCFTGHTALHDDACLSILACVPAEQYVLTSEARRCREARDFIEAWARFAGFSDLERGQMVLAVDEAVTNVIRHTYQMAVGQQILVNAAVDAENLTFRIRDFGPPIASEKLQGRALEDIKPGGLGIHLLNITFSKVEFTPLPDGNRLTLTKALPGGCLDSGDA